jgi:hypothetical protein
MGIGWTRRLVAIGEPANTREPAPTASFGFYATTIRAREEETFAWSSWMALPRGAKKSRPATLTRY